MGLDYEQSLFFLGPPEQNARDTQMTTRVTERLPPWFLASRGFAAQHSCGRALPLLNLKKTRDCSQSIMGFKLVTPARLDCKTVGFFLKISKEFGKAWRRSLFSASFQTFCWTARSYLNTQKYGLFCSLRRDDHGFESRF